MAAAGGRALPSRRRASWPSKQAAKRAALQARASCSHAQNLGFFLGSRSATSISLICLRVGWCLVRQRAARLQPLASLSELAPARQRQGRAGGPRLPCVQPPPPFQGGGTHPPGHPAQHPAQASTHQPSTQHRPAPTLDAIMKSFSVSPLAACVVISATTVLKPVRCRSCVGCRGQHGGGVSSAGGHSAAHRAQRAQHSSRAHAPAAGHAAASWQRAHRVVPLRLGNDRYPLEQVEAGGEVADLPLVLDAVVALRRLAQPPARALKPVGSRREAWRRAESARAAAEHWRAGRTQPHSSVLCFAARMQAGTARSGRGPGRTPASAGG